MKNIYLLFFYYLIYLISCQDNSNEKNQDEEMPDINPIFKDFYEKWNKILPTFVSQYMHSIPIQYNSEAQFFENITKTPCNFQGAVVLDDATTKDDIIEIKIIAPNNTVIFQEASVASIFSLNLTDKGLYTISINNRFLYRNVRPFLMANSGQNLILEKENLSETEKKLDSIITFLQKFEQDSKLYRGFKRKINEELSKTNKYFYTFSLIETITLVSVSIWQYFYLKHLFEVKGSL